MSETVGDALPKEMARIRDVVIPAYQSIGPAGGLAIALMKADLDAAARAMIEGDVVQIITSLKALREYEL